jgi:N-acetylmuramoyl-L-alanine amidase
VKSAPDGAGNRPVIIALDAGHGGQDPGATGANGTHEKDVTLAIARELAERINREPGMKAVLTRNGDYFIPLDQRRKLAHDANADMFVSIHADAIADRSVSGASVYVVSSKGASSASAKMLADTENAADLKGGVSLSDVSNSVASVILDLSGTASRAHSVEAADAIERLEHRVGVVRKPEVQYAAFVVIKALDIPSMLVETAYISNPSEERRLRTPAGQDALAGAIFGGIRSYFVTHPPVGTRFAEPVKLARSGR